MRPTWKQRLFAAVAALLPLSASAAPIAYAVGFSDLYRIDLATGQANKIGPIGFNDVEGLAFAPDGSLYAVADATMAIGGNNSATTDFLLRINTSTGAGSLVGQLPGLQQPSPNDQLDYGLAFTCDGRLWLSSDTSTQLWEVNPANAAVALVGSMGAPISGLAANGQGLFGVSTEPGGALYRINTGNASVQRVGSLELADRMYDAGADFDGNGRLWTTIDYFSPPTGLPPLRNDVAQVDPATGQRLATLTISGAGTGIDTVQMEGLAIAPTAACGSNPGTGTPAPGAPEVVPVDSPWMLTLLALVLMPLAWRRLR